MSGRSTGGKGPVVAIGTRAAQSGVYAEPGSGGSAVEGVGTTGNGVKGIGTSGVGVYGVATAGYGVVAEGDTTTPEKCAFRIVPQDTLPTNALVGDLCVISGKLNICTVSHTTTPTFVVVGAQTT